MSFTTTSPDQIARGNLTHDEDLSSDSPAGHMLFQYASENGFPFQIHLDIEDQYLALLQKTLEQYPKQKSSGGALGMY